ncbi:hypothetical protein J6590_023894 [Homalodisca vitripennis]|nr:hypothetical protein J6590_023894 [Homalodisca vitripennis]
MSNTELRGLLVLSRRPWRYRLTTDNIVGEITARRLLRCCRLLHRHDLSSLSFLSTIHLSLSYQFSSKYCNREWWCQKSSPQRNESLSHRLPGPKYFTVLRACARVRLPQHWCQVRCALCHRSPSPPPRRLPPQHWYAISSRYAPTVSEPSTTPVIFDRLNCENPLPHPLFPPYPPSRTFVRSFGVFYRYADYFC